MSKERDPESARANLRRFRASKRAQIDEWKRRPCEDCGGVFHPFAMDFDHREGSDKRFNVSAGIVYGFSLETIRAEADKCDVVCAVCHRLRTWRRIERDRASTPEAAPARAKRTHCPEGHPYAGENLRTRVRRGGLSRECVQCVRARDRERGRDRRRRANPPGSE